MKLLAADPLLKLIVENLQTEHGCHTVILYGSRARGDATPQSDYDILGIRESGDELRDARLWNGVYLDIFVYPESKLLTPDETLVHVRHGKVLCEKAGAGTRFLSRLEEVFRAGPKKLRVDEIQARKAWAGKMLTRVKAGDTEGNYRRVWLLTALLEDYFVTRGEWYCGPKESLKYLGSNHPRLFRSFDEALQPGAPISAIEALVQEIHSTL